ncbi:TRAP transporter substrate-binding protein DctP [Desulfoluna spongiiphila]|uniref:TRAP transporter substrate-binding protein DctP n=1 Tax=Desulfoluna spongiiphila TaxID=419481 RepID=UPI001252EA2E|nr:TRAP transporter substrate-binding protein DctP [Desulfoluna spongiiphila]VVS95699.1 trap transporter solute receptor dctp/teaa [Desulfoluna spongiiphila]
MNRFLNTAAAILVALGLSAGCSKDDTETPDKATPVTLRMATQFPENHPAHAAALRIKDAVEKGTEGRINITIFPESQLGSPEQVYDGVSSGSIDAAHIRIPDQADPRLGTGDLPYIAADYRELKHVFAPEAFIPVQVAKLLKKKDVKFFGYYVEGFVGVGTTGEAQNLTNLGTDKGIVVSVSGLEAIKTGIQALGFRTTALPYTDVHAALQAGVVDGWAGGPPSLNYSGFSDVITTYYQLNCNVQSSQYIMSMKAFKSFSAPDQEVIARAFAAEGQNSFDIAEQEDIGYRRKLTEAGVTVNEFSRHELRAMADYVRDKTWPELDKTLTRKWMEGLKEWYSAQ